MIRAVTFDAVGTLVALREPVGDTYARVAGRHGIAALPASVDIAFRQAFRSAPPLAFPGASPDALPARERAWWRAVVGPALGVADGDPRLGPCVDALFAHYASPDAWTVYDDVAPALERLRDRGLGLGVVSNFDGRLPGILAGLGLRDRFDTIVWSSMAGAAKPAPEIFELAARRLGIDVVEISHVGDDLAADVAGARAAGAGAIHLDRSGTSPDAIATLHALRLRPDD